MRAVTDRLSRSVEAEPPASLWSSVLAEIATMTQERPSTDSEDTADKPSRASSAEVTSITSRPDRRAGRTSRVSALVAESPSWLAVGFGGWAPQAVTTRSRRPARRTLVDLLAAPDAGPSRLPCRAGQARWCCPTVGTRWRSSRLT